VKLVVGLLALGAAATTAGCSSSSCDDAVGNTMKLMGVGGASYGKARAEGIKQCTEQKWSTQARSCMAAAASREALMKCVKDEAGSKKRGGGLESYATRSKQAEAELELGILKKRLKIYYGENEKFPIGTAGPTPPGSGGCCGDGGKTRCDPTPALWTADPIWSALDFEMTEPHYFRYAYESGDGRTVKVRAIGDLDCDSIPGELVLDGRIEEGEPAFTLTKPAQSE
jgi:hypothetical protein